MACPEEPMDIDSDFDNKENTFHHSNVLPCTEKGYEELDVSELNMKLRYSITPGASPMSKSYTNCTDHRNLDSDDSLNLLNENNLTRSLNSTMTKNDNVNKSLKSIPLQLLTTDGDNNRSTSVLKQLESTTTSANNVTLTVSGTNDIDENSSLPSSSSSTIYTPEATTPTKEIPKTDEGSPIMRGLKSVLNMFRSSQSPIPPADGDNITPKHEVLSPAEASLERIEVKGGVRSQAVLASTPIAAHRNKESTGSKRNSPYKDSIVFNDDLEKELQWKDETTIIFSQEKIPIHKLFFQQAKYAPRMDVESKVAEQKIEGSNFNLAEYMDISCNDSLIADKTMTEQSDLNKNEFVGANESDNEFLDCETMFTKNEFAENTEPEINEVDNNNVSNVTIDTDLKQQACKQPVACKYEIVNVNTPEESQNETSISFHFKKIDLSGGQIEDNICKNSMTDSLDINNVEQYNSTVCELPAIKNIILDAPYDSYIPLNVTVDTSAQCLYADTEQQCLGVTKSVEATVENEVKTIETIIDNSIISVGYESDSLNHTANTSYVNKTDNLNDHDLVSVIIQITAQNPKSSQFTANLEVTTATNVSKNYLPIDVPLPDEDDLEKDCIIPVEDLTSASKHFPPDLMDINTIKSEVTDLVHTIDIRQNSKINSTVTFVNNHEVPEIMPPLNVSMEDDYTIKLESNANNLSEVINDLENLLACNEITCTNNTEQINKTKDLQVMGMNGIITDLQILPDPINQTITISNQDIVEHIESCELLNRVLPIPNATTQINTVVEVSSNLEKETTNINVKDKEISLPEGLEQTEDTSNVIIEQNRIIDTSEQISIIAEENLHDIHLSKSLDVIQPITDLQMMQNKIFDTSTKVEAIPKIEENNVHKDIQLNCSQLIMQNNKDYQNEQSRLIEHNTNSVAICITTVDNINERPLPGCVEQIQHRIPVSEVEKNIIIDGSGNQIMSLTPLSECLEKTQFMPLHHTENSRNISDSQTMENVNNKENNQYVPPITTLEHHTEIISYTDNDVESSKPLDSEIIDQNREIPEIILIGNKVLKVTEDSNTQEKSDVQQPTFGPILECKKINCELNSTIILQETKKVDEQNLYVNKITKYSNVEQTGDFSKQDMIMETQQTYYEGDVKVDQCISNIDHLETKKEDLKAIVEDLPFDTNHHEYHRETVKTAIIDEEVVLSENNSPYVSVAGDLNIISELEPSSNILEAENPFVTRTNVASSPPITSKGYNFNFDEIGDPFATKTKIRMSPGPDTHEKSIELIRDKSEKTFDTHMKDINKNRRKSLTQRNKPVNIKKKHNITFDGNTSTSKLSPKNLDTTLPEITKLDTKTEETMNPPSPDNAKIIMNDKDCANTTPTLAIFDRKLDETKVVEAVLQDLKGAETSSENNIEKLRGTISTEENKSLVESVTTFTDASKNSSSEQSTYYSAGTSSNESIKSKNVFNLPEIHDFNPFATKSRILQSPPSNLEVDPFSTSSKMRSSPDFNTTVVSNTKVEEATTTLNIENTKFTSIDGNTDDKMETEAMEKDSNVNINNSTCSSETTNEKDNTVREIHTEDEDTIEGPFLEAEDLDNVDKMSDSDGQNVDMMQFNELPAPENEENGDGELFIDAEAFEFLLNQNKSNMVADSGKESLFLKFDPLFAKRMSSDVVAALSKVGKRQSTPVKVSKPKKDMTSPVAGPSNLNVTYETDFNNTNIGITEDLNITVSKPMMVVTPAVNPAAMSRKSLTPTRSNRRSITFTSPAMAVIDRLLSLSANNSFAEHETTITQVSREQHEADFALTQLRELLAEKEINVYNLRSESKELKDRLSTLESQMKILETQGQERLQKINNLTEKLSEKTKMNKSMAAVVEEYERTIASLIAETEQDKKLHADERTALISERDEQTAHLASMEVAFNDLHSKYEKSKQVILSYKANEDKCKKSLEDFEKNITKMQSNYELLKQHATSKLNHANDELQKMNKTHEAEILKMNAMIKRKEMHLTSLEETLAHKTKANEELTAICDELINKVG